METLFAEPWGPIENALVRQHVLDAPSRFVERQALPEIAAQEGEKALVPACGRRIGCGADRGVEAGERLVEAAERLKEEPPIVQSFDVLRCERDGRREAGQRLVVTPQRLQRVYPVVESVDIVGLKRDRVIEAVQRFGVSLERHEHAAAIVVRRRQIWFQCDRAFLLRQRLGMAPEGLQSIALPAVFLRLGAGHRKDRAATQVAAMGER